MSIADNKARYEASALKVLIESTNHHICELCYCCDCSSESTTCWSCNGMTEWDGDDWDDGWCDVCEGEGEVYYWSCLGRCDENGEHKQKAQMERQKEESR